MRKYWMPLVPLFAWALGVSGCGDDNGANFKFTGRVTNLAVSSVTRAAQGPVRVTKNVSHVMAVNPQSANPQRVLAAVGGDGSFSLDVQGNRPWVLVFIDNSKTGKEKIVGLLKMGSLDTLPARNSEGEASVGETTIDGSTQTASSAVPLATVLAQLGVTQAEADVIGAIDDIAARYANPDVDGNGVLDVEEGKSFLLDFHIRWNHNVSGNTQATIDDLVNAYLPTSSNIAYSLGTAFGIWPQSFHTGPYTNGSGALTGGNSLALTPDSAPDDYGDLAYGDRNGFGGNWDDSGNSMAGSGGTPATYAYAFGGHTLTFTNVVTYNNAALNNNTNRIMPFIRFNVDGSNRITSVDYKWMRYTGSAWVDATLAEVGLVVNDDGGYLNVHKGPQSANRSISFRIPPTSLTGTFAWSTAGAAAVTGLTDADLSAMTKDELCHLGLSYDDKLGMRIFDSFSDGDNAC